jgi:uncharacterized membrane protein
MQAPTERIQLIERSLRCFVFGLLSLAPLIGLGLALLAIRLHWQTWADSGGAWNPARSYLLRGFCLACLGFLLSLVVIALFVVFLMRRYDY